MAKPKERRSKRYSGVYIVEGKKGRTYGIDYYHSQSSERIRKIVKGVTSEAEADEIVNLFKTCGSWTVSGIRDASMLAVLYGTGLRRSEVISLLNRLPRKYSLADVPEFPSVEELRRLNAESLSYKRSPAFREELRGSMVLS